MAEINGSTNVENKPREIYIALVKSGEPESRAADLVGVPIATWHALESEDADFAARLADARGCRGILAVNARQAIFEGVKSGNPWFLKCAIRNFDLGLIDPEEPKEPVRTPKPKKRGRPSSLLGI